MRALSILTLLIALTATGFAADPQLGLGPNPNPVGVATVTGGTIDNTIIGGTTPAAGTFTSITDTGNAIMTAAAPTLTIGGNTSTAPILLLNAAAANSRTFRYQTAGVVRWEISTTAAVESGADAGSAFALSAYTDAGVFIDSPITITRAAANTMTLSRPINIVATNEAIAIGNAALCSTGGLTVAKRSFLGTIGATFKGNVDAGVQDATAAVTGQVGEVLSVTVSTYTNSAATATYGQITTLSLTAGDWDVTGYATVSGNGATLTATSDTLVALGTTTASAAGTTEGLGDIAHISQVYNNVSGKQSVSLHKRVLIGSTTSYFLNGQATFSAGNPQFVGSIVATRIR